MSHTSTDLKSSPITDALKYWEPRRVIYNLVLAILTLVVSFQEFVDVLGDSAWRTFGLFLIMGVLMVLANICYCAAYVPEFLVRFTPFKHLWPKFRWVVFTSGTALACMIVVVMYCFPHPM